ncbi:hypothetical protein KUCAC02_011192 [Chaenocephalus aceratus]|uniref:Uncharacterized protein n=1 Tax=Chaenocephalus aceratus TaxID=36190 RepID=A0ACB9WUZ0_CHAAC|nr:hypothetical protein KUCAC02_011192 [Chaenocephalus aceratus]
MLRTTLWLLVGVFVWGFASCITCPDGNHCSDHATCCMTEHGYSCCQYPNAVCCADLAHCCPSGFRCNLVTQMCEKAPWMTIPMVKKEAAEKPSTPVRPASPIQELQNNAVPEQTKSSNVYCDSYFRCPDGYTCCRQPTGAWFCCVYYLGRCCLDGYHCCPYGYDCDHTYTRCVRRGLSYPFSPRESLTSIPASPISTSKDKSIIQETPMTALTETKDGFPESGVIRCNDKLYCSAGTTCCKDTKGHWSCCPFPLGICCKDGKHCCKYGLKCSSTSLSCEGGYAHIPSGPREHAKSTEDML